MEHEDFPTNWKPVLQVGLQYDPRSTLSVQSPRVSPPDTMGLEKHEEMYDKLTQDFLSLKQFVKNAEETSPPRKAKTSSTPGIRID